MIPSLSLSLFFVPAAIAGAVVGVLLGLGLVIAVVVVVVVIVRKKRTKYHLPTWRCV